MLTHRTRFETNRLAGFSDGVFAICITLLVLELKMPDSSRVNLLTALGSIIHKIESWALSFLVIGSLWVMQHNIHAQLRATDTALLWINLLFLMFISLMPWTTYLIGIYVHEPLPIIIFSGTLGLAGLVLMIEWVYAYRRGELTLPEIDSQAGILIAVLAARIPVVALISIALAFFHRSLALYCWLLVLICGLAIRFYIRAAERSAMVAKA